MSRASPPAIPAAEIIRKTPNLWIGGTSVAIVWDEPLEGRARPWFECPACRRRRRHLYLRDHIACRQCLGLDYAVRHINQQIPALARVARLRRRLGGCDLAPFSPLPARIRSGRGGRSRARHARLCAEIHAEESKLVAHLESVNFDLSRRARLRDMLAESEDTTP